jgi:hypothetical protein
MPIDASGKTLACLNCRAPLQHDNTYLYCRNTNTFCDSVMIDDALSGSLMVPEHIADDLLHICETTVAVPAPKDTPEEMGEIWAAINYAHMSKPQFDSLEEKARKDHQDASSNVRTSNTTTLYVGVRTDGTRVVLGVKHA